MEQYIPKSTLVAEMERRIYTYKNVCGADRRTDALVSLKNYLDTLEVKEVNLEKEIIDWWNAHYSVNYSVKDYTFEGYAGHYLENSTVIEIAKHFFELGLKVREGA